uniref:Uncharacterized protein n=1 Tax=Anguilla anguilla TaxID=7936 RepID=A0A0E9RFT3_ANGAN
MDGCRRAASFPLVDYRNICTKTEFKLILGKPVIILNSESISGGPHCLQVFVVFLSINNLFRPGRNLVWITLKKKKKPFTVHNDYALDNNTTI